MNRRDLMISKKIIAYCERIEKEHKIRYRDSKRDNVGDEFHQSLFAKEYDF